MARSGKGFLVLCAAFIVAFSPAGVRAQSEGDEALLRAGAKEYEKAYAAGQAKSLAGMWTPDGTYTDSDGEKFSGRAAIEDLFTRDFKAFGSPPLKVSIDSIKFLTPDVALEEGSCQVERAKGEPAVSRYTVVHVKRDGKWLMADVTETASAAPRKNGLKDMGWMIGNWTATCPSRPPLHVKVDWAAEGNFIRCEYRAADHDKPQQVQILGWDPSAGRIASWHFHSDGGFGYGSWVKNGKEWMEYANGVEADGTASGGVYVLKRLDDDKFTWRSTGRRYGVDNMPDTPEIMVSRDRAVANSEGKQ